MTAPDGTDVFVRPPGGVPVPAGGVLRGVGPHLDGTVEEAIRAGLEVTELPFGVVEIVVVSGLGAGIVHRLEVGRYRCGGDAEADVPLPTRATWWVDVRCGGVVRLESAENAESAVRTDAEGPRAERDLHDVVLDVVLDDVVADDGGPGDGRTEPEPECDPSPEPDTRAWSEPWPVGERRRVGGLELLLRWCAGPAEALRPVAGLPLADVLLDRVSGAEAAGSDAAPAERFTWELGRTDGEVVSVDLAAEPLLTVIGEHRHVFARALLGRLIASWGPDRLRLTLLAPGVDEGRSQWAWMRWLPHARCHDERFVRAGFDDAACARLVGEIAAAPGGSVDVVVVDGVAGDPRRIARPGLAVLVLGERDGVGPVVDVAGPRAHVRGLAGVGDVDVDLPALEWSERLARTTAVAEHGRVVSGGRLAELLEVEPDDADAVAGRWAGRPSTRVPVGRVVDAGKEGAATVDLRTDGPHALVGGTTGSGKSELLQTLVASLAAVNPPEAMSFLLVDYKGGAAFAECARLPHTVGLVTDLDHGLTQRALSSLTAEVRRRERLLAEAGVTDLDAYLATGQGELARLVIVVDEFATLAAELPEFVDGVVDIARRGRSLGLHLVLATQRPAGAVSPDIRANTTLRISLRVAEAADSVDVIGEPDAAAIDEKEPGRALVRVGRKPLVTIQAARVTLPGPTSVPHGTPYVFGEPVEELAARSDLARMVDTMRSVATSRGVPLPPSPWLPPLPPRLGLDVLDAELGSGVAPQPPIPGTWRPAPGIRGAVPDSGPGTLSAGRPRRSGTRRTWSYRSDSRTARPSNAARWRPCD
ncbi:FtsK/SpoIIIE domain-containing protein [Mobilicoccus caccae]|uniref:FtsK domain-containing protein n=1 Tax=Mobilicoccus caccae TaxID=1859295 RepID=A0ABQ6IXL4_9MICO|nr:FtsK/SpoIIIE domain-containing protein [Mobilicoccus caccae]GMA41482.1 hypothetical protein GCM10025883_35270 [Mobilicoccus caccae]